jgi:glycosyltransferase involved in cell wall biosynthesis
MRRFGSILPFPDSGRGTRFCRPAPDYEFVRALLKYGSFDEYVFANTTISSPRLFQQTIHRWGLGDDQLAGIVYISVAELPQMVHQRSFHAFHVAGWGAHMPGLHYLRSRYARNPWPVTSVTHSLHGPDLIDEAVRLTHAGMAPYDALFCPSRDDREAMRRLLAEGASISGGRYEGTLEQLPLGIDDDLFDRRGDRDRTRDRLNIPRDATVLLMVGRLALSATTTPLFRLAAREIMPQSHRPVVLLLAGDATADDLDVIHRAAGEYDLDSNVRVLANFAAEQKADVLAASDVLVSAVDNMHDACGLWVLEGMAAGLPIVASRFDGYKDLVEDGVNGFLIDTYASAANPLEDLTDLMDPDHAEVFHAQGMALDLDQLANRLLRVVVDEPLRAAMGAAGRLAGSRDYRWSRVIARYESIWDRLSDEADHAGIAPATGDRNPYGFGPRQLFSHFTSHTLSSECRVMATGSDLDASVLHETSIAVRPALLRAILDSSQDATTLECLAAAVGASLDHTSYATACLLKYGALRVVAKAPQPVQHVTSTAATELPT